MPEQQTPLLVFSNLIIWFLLYKKIKLSGLKLSRGQIKIIFCGIVFFCLFSFWGLDWFHYNDYFETVKRYGTIDTLEQFYIWIINDFCPNYLIFRIIVWGGASVLLFKIIRVTNINFHLSIYFFCSIWLIWFAYARASLAMAVVFWGYALLSQKENESICKSIICIIIILISSFFHKSAYFGILCCLLAFLMCKISPKLLLPLTLSFPILSIFLGYVIDDIMLLDSDIHSESAFEVSMASGKDYLNKGNQKDGPTTLLLFFCERTPYYLLALASFRCIVLEKINVPQSIKSFMLLQFLIVFLVTGLALGVNANTYVLYIRLLRYSPIPSLIVLTYLYENGMYPKLTNIVIKIGSFGAFYTLIYTLYNSYMAS